MTQLADIARLTRLSSVTVSHILGNRRGYSAVTRARVLAAARQLDYHPNLIARQLRQRQSNVIGVVIGVADAAVNYDRLAQLELLAVKHDYRLMIGQADPGMEEAAITAYADDFEARGVVATVWLHQPASDDGRRGLKRLRRDRRILFLDDPLSPDGYSVAVDYAAGIAQAVRYLVARGRRRIGLALATLVPGSNPTTARLKGFEQACIDARLRGFRQRFWVGQETGLPTSAQIDSLIDALIVKRRADALLASNDVWAIHLLNALRRRGIRVPDDVAVVGFDNLEWTAWMDPPLTSIDQQHARFAAAALELIGQMRDPSLAEPHASRRRVVVPVLVERGTT